MYMNIMTITVKAQSNRDGERGAGRGGVLFMPEDVECESSAHLRT